MNYRYAATVLAIKNDFCVEEAIAAIKWQGVEKVLIVSPVIYWADGTPQSPQDFEELSAIADRTGAELASLECKSDMPENAPLYTEALYRNFAADYLCDDPSIDYIVTVDADELWQPGTLEHVDQLAAANKGASIVLPGIPVVAGLPVQGATDGILVATPRDTRFDWCRSVSGPRVTGTLPVLHFSLTRRTEAELISKCYKSAHYSDPAYDFDGWIRNTLPNVHVGMKNVHMYKSEVNIWPEIRTWTTEEMEAVPVTLWPYLRSSTSRP